MRPNLELGSYLGIEDVAVELPDTADLLHHEDLAIAFTTFWILALWCDGSTRRSANEANVAAQLNFLDIKLHVEVHLREAGCVGSYYLLNPDSGGEGLADEHRVISIDGSDQVQVSSVQRPLVCLNQVLDFFVHN